VEKPSEGFPRRGFRRTSRASLIDERQSSQGLLSQNLASGLILPLPVLKYKPFLSLRNPRFPLFIYTVGSANSLPHIFIIEIKSLSISNHEQAIDSNELKYVSCKALKFLPKE
jgi:hypothetical protein